MQSETRERLVGPLFLAAKPGFPAGLSPLESGLGKLESLPY